MSASGASNHTGFLSATGFSSATATWRDIIFLNGSSPFPNEIRLAVSVTGQFDVSVSSGPFIVGHNSLVQAAVQVVPGQYHESRENGGLFGTHFPLGASLFVNADTGGGSVFDSGWDSSTLNPDGSFEGQFSFLVPFDDDVGGYSFVVSGAVWGFGRGGAASADFGNSFGLGFTQADGSELDGFDVSFDSGFSQAPAGVVPEPSSLSLLTGLAICAGGSAWLRSRRKRRPRHD